MAVSHPLIDRIVLWGRVVKFSHTIFAMPFALSMLLIAARDYPLSVAQLAWIVAALVTARTAAMSFNRLVDAEIDERNPRTCSREIPSGQVSRASVLLLLLFSSALFLLSAAMLGTHCLALAPLVLGTMFFYSLTKRFTQYSHFVLGLSLALAPGGVWYALSAEIAWLPVPLMIGILLWVSGFDVLYSCQDTEFDRQHGLRSLPARYGNAAAFRAAKILHALCVPAFAVFGLLAGLGVSYWIGLAAFAIVLASQYRLISADDLSKIDAAFFNRNGLASVLILLAVALDRLG